MAALVWRFVSGAHMHGERKTDAGFFTHGTRSKRHEFDQTGWMNTWEHKPHSHRILWRFGILFGFIGFIYGLIVATMITLNACAALIVYGLMVVGFTVERKLRLRLHTRQIVKPSARTLAPVLRLSEHAVRKLIHIDPDDIKDEGEVGYFGPLPDGLTPGEDQQATIERVIDAHLPVDIEMIWKFSQQPRIGVIRAGLKPPPMVVWDETVKAMERAAYGEIVIGKDRFKNIFSANFIDQDDPHWAFCVQSKRGKSNFLGLVAVQVLHQNPLARIMAIDPKRSSLIDFLGSPDYCEGVSNGLKPLIPGVSMACDPTNPEAMWNIITQARKLFDSRSREYARDRNKKFPICLVIVDELNMLRGIIGDMWDDIVAENNRRPKEDREILGRECPMWADIRMLLQAGRFVGIHVIAVAQDFRDDTIGGKGGRNLFGLRAMAGYQPNQWKYFMSGTHQESQNGVGRWIFGQGERKDWVQVTHCDADKAYAWGSYGRELYVAEDDDDESVRHDIPHSYTLSSLDDRTDGHAVERARVVGQDAAAAFFGVKTSAFEKQRTRWKKDHGEIPGMFKVGTQPAWYCDELARWEGIPKTWAVPSVSDY